MRHVSKSIFLVEYEIGLSFNVHCTQKYLKVKIHEKSSKFRKWTDF